MRVNIMKQINKIFMNKNVTTVLYVIVVIGIVLMLFPKSQNVTKTEQTEKAEDTDTAQSVHSLERRLEQLLSMSEGAGRVKVMLTYKDNGSVILAEDSTDDESTGDNTRVSRQSNVVLNGENMPVVLSEVSPQIEGVVIVAEGGGNIEVKNSLIKAAEALTGAEAHKIEVLKMKTEG
jgi:stage III sporulation protein AG